MSDKPFVVLDNDESDENVVDGNLNVSGDGNPSVSGDERPQRPLFPLNGVSIFGLFGRFCIRCEFIGPQ